MTAQDVKDNLFPNEEEVDLVKCEQILNDPYYGLNE